MASSIQPSLPSGEGAPANANSSSSASSAPDAPPSQTTAHWTSTEAWEMAFAQDHWSDDGQYDIIWDSDDAPMALKPEPLDDDDFNMDDLKEAPLTPILTAADLLRVKRPRGRPRKYPTTPTIAAAKKGRSKTGCLTCRRRKKKCDEVKPRCMNCEKNSLVCEGYLDKQIWKSGKEKAEERMKFHTLPLTPLQPIFYGLETLEDRIFWKHYNEHLSTVLTVEGDYKNACKDMMDPIAVKHQGLMHSILSLASKHIDFDTPYGINILRDNPNTTLEALRERSIYHGDEARQKFCVPTNAVEIDITIRDWVPHLPPGDCRESVGPNDPSQRLLLLPCFIIGTASVTQEHQDAVRIAIKAFKGYTGMRNADNVMSVLEEVWRLMSVGEWLAVWDWPEVARNMGLDFIPA
ncbi:hypothetical protein B0T22DRAFT_513414 [Podospora appendiculata]|uniref:Zn(2)-C6 fungal-type domain-containing protein n=1 Tax=Podospora appendiculata TaxID=314037 RepID=A0AAE1CDA6_9PEZI|nr:hypothetical protein B0T22DRAFT_513414 [Podospora appendiculata]